MHAHHLAIMYVFHLVTMHSCHRWCYDDYNIEPYNNMSMYNIRYEMLLISIKNHDILYSHDTMSLTIRLSMS